MDTTNLQSASHPADTLKAFAQRTPSQSWEQAPLADGGDGVYLWVWYKPANLPTGLFVRIPDELYQSHSQLAAKLTMRKLLQAAGIDPRCVASWLIHGTPIDAAGGTSPYLDAAIPPPVADADPSIAVQLMVAPVAAAQASPAADQSAMPAGEGHTVAELFERIDTDWKATIELERELTRLRKMLLDSYNRIKAMNRELTPTERLHSDNQDKKDWQDARRILREASMRLWQYIKAHDIGDMSTAGQRTWFEHTYLNFVVPRRPFDKLLQAQRDYESHRKMVQSLHDNMRNAHNMAKINGERRAERVLARIAAKIRDAQTKRNMLGMMLD